MKYGLVALKGCEMLKMTLHKCIKQVSCLPCSLGSTIETFGLLVLRVFGQLCTRFKFLKRHPGGTLILNFMAIRLIAGATFSQL